MRRRFSGQSMVEFAFVLPVFLLMTFGVIEGGRLLFTYHQVSNAAREGARYAITQGTEGDSQIVEANVTAHILSSVAGLDAAAIGASATWDGTEPGDAVTVTVDYAYEPIISMVFGTGDIALNASSTMRFHY